MNQQTRGYAVDDISKFGSSQESFLGGLSPPWIPGVIPSQSHKYCFGTSKIRKTGQDFIVSYGQSPLFLIGQ